MVGFASIGSVGFEPMHVGGADGIDGGGVELKALSTRLTRHLLS